METLKTIGWMVRRSVGLVFDLLIAIIVTPLSVMITLAIIASAAIRDDWNSDHCMIVRACLWLADKVDELI